MRNQTYKIFRHTTNSTQYNKLYREYITTVKVSLCPICGWNSGCNRYRRGYKAHDSWKNKKIRKQYLKHQTK